MTDHPNRSAGIESAGFSDIEAAQAIASIANECCYRSDGWEEHIAEEGLKIIRSIRGTPAPAQSAAQPPAAPGENKKGDQVHWLKVNDEPFEYAIQQGPHGDEFVKLLNGECLRRLLQSCSAGNGGEK